MGIPMAPTSEAEARSILIVEDERIVARDLCMTLEEMGAGGDRNYRLEPHGRYSHRPDYVRASLEDAGLRLVCSEEQVLRRERGADVLGLVITAKQ